MAPGVAGVSYRIAVGQFSLILNSYKVHSAPCSILDEIPDHQSGTFFWSCMAVRTCESIGMSAYLTAMFSVVASEFSDGVTTAFVRCPRCVPPPRIVLCSLARRAPLVQFYIAINEY